MLVLSVFVPSSSNESLTRFMDAYSEPGTGAEHSTRQFQRENSLFGHTVSLIHSSEGRNSGLVQIWK